MASLENWIEYMVAIPENKTVYRFYKTFCVFFSLSIFLFEFVDLL